MHIQRIGKRPTEIETSEYYSHHLTKYSCLKTEYLLNVAQSFISWKVFKEGKLWIYKRKYNRLRRIQDTPVIDLNLYKGITSAQQSKASV